MDPAKIQQFAWTNDGFLNGPIRGVILEFPGLGGNGMKGEGPNATVLEWGQAGGLAVLPFQDSWGWMNPQTAAFTDELIDAIFARYALAPDTPIIATGCSMGGFAALLYPIVGRHNVVAVAANCPATDLPFHYTERPDLPRTLHHAFGSYSDISEALIAHSPQHQAHRLPDVPYLVIQGDQDTLVDKARHSDTLVPKMRELGLTVDYREQRGMGHCGPLDWTLHRLWTDFVLSHLAEAK